MTDLTLAETVARWKAREPSERQSLILHLARLLAVLVVIYAVGAPFPVVVVASDRHHAVHPS